MDKRPSSEERFMPQTGTFTADLEPRSWSGLFNQLCRNPKPRDCLTLVPTTRAKFSNCPFCKALLRRACYPATSSNRKASQVAGTCTSYSILQMRLKSGHVSGRKHITKRFLQYYQELRGNDIGMRNGEAVSQRQCLIDKFLIFLDFRLDTKKKPINCLNWRTLWFTVANKYSAKRIAEVTIHLNDDATCSPTHLNCKTIILN